MTQHPDDVDVVVAKYLVAEAPNSTRDRIELLLRIMREQGWLIVQPSDRKWTPPLPIPPHSTKR